MEPEAELLHRYAEAQDQGAFAELVQRHLDGVYSSALRRLGGDTYLAEDVAQKVFIDLAQRARSLSRHPALSGWLFTTTRNHAANTVRTEQRRKLREKEAHLMKETPSHDSSELDWSRVAPVLDWAIDQLSTSDRTAVLLRFIDRKSFIEIGAALKLTDDAARRRVDRALEKLRNVLAKRGILSSAAAVGIGLTNHAVLAAPAGVASAVTAASSIAYGLGSVGPVAAFFEIMTTSKLAAGLAGGLFILGTLGPATRAVNARQTTERSLAATDKNYQNTVAELRAIQQRIQQTNTATLALEKSLSDQQKALAAATSAAEAERKRAAASDPKAVGQAFWTRHPEVKAAYLDWLTAKQNAEYGGLFKALQLTPQQVEELRILMREHGGFARNLDAESNEYAYFSVAANLSSSELQRRLRALLGESGLRQFLEAGDHQPSRDAAAQAAAGLIFTEAPITAGLTKQFMAVLSKYEVPNSRGIRFDWDAVTKEAAQFLSPSQLIVIDQIRAQDEYNEAVNRRSVTRSP